MSVSEKTIRVIQQSYRDDFGEEISYAEAKESAERLLELYRLLAKPTPQELEAMKQQQRDQHG